MKLPDSRQRAIMCLLAILFISVALLTATPQKAYSQVNINSKNSDSDNSFFELSDTDDTVITNSEYNNQVTPTAAPTIVQASLNIPLINSFNQSVDNLENNLANNPNVPPFIKSMLATFGLPASIAIVFSLGYLPLIFAFGPILSSPRMFFLILASLFGEQKHVWGIISDGETKQPIPFAVVRLFDRDSTTLVTQKVSDLQGRYGFILSEGNYRVQVDQTGYARYEDLVTIEKKTQLFAKDIALGKASYDTLRKRIANYLATWKGLMFRFSIYLSLIGLIFAITAMIFDFTVLNFVLAIFYGLTILLYLYLKYRENRSWGIVVDSETGLKIASATVRLFDPKNSLSDTQLTDAKGRFGFIVDPGEYTFLANASGYSFPSKKQKQFKPNKENPLLLDLKYETTQNLNAEIFMDPMQTGQTQAQPLNAGSASNAVSNILTPFGG